MQWRENVGSGDGGGGDGGNHAMCERQRCREQPARQEASGRQADGGCLISPTVARRGEEGTHRPPVQAGRPSVRLRPTRRSVPDWFPTAHFAFRPSARSSARPFVRRPFKEVDGRTDGERRRRSLDLRSDLRRSFVRSFIRPPAWHVVVVVCCLLSLLRSCKKQVDNHITRSNN